MCENNYNSPATTNCEGTNVSEGTTVISSPTGEDARNSYITSLLGDISKLNNDLDNEKLNCSRFQQLYQVCLDYIMTAIQKNDISELAGVTKRLVEIEAK